MSMGFLVQDKLNRQCRSENFIVCEDYEPVAAKFYCESKGETFPAEKIISTLF